MYIKTFPEIILLNTRFHKVKVQELIDYLIEAAKSPKKTIVGNVNIRAMNFAYEKSWYQDFLNKADLVFCDGFGVLIGAKLNGYSMQSIHRITAPDYIENLVLKCEKEKLSLFLLAGKPGIVDKAITKLLAIAPDLRIEGHNGYFDKSGNENDLVIEKINLFRPNILYIGFGMPLQERWILDNFNEVETSVFLPLGACLDFYTNSIYRGPCWLTDNGFEWLTRLITEPTRLWDRYLIGNPLFFYRLFKHQITQRLIANR